jgi:hypothetical protein
MLLVGGIIGAVSIWCVSVAQYSQTERVDTPEPALVRCEAELGAKTAEIEALKKQVAVAAQPAAADSQQAVEIDTEHGVNKSSTGSHDGADRASAWRISAIEKFVPLTDEQKARLERKFTEEQQAQQDGRESSAESLDEILGADNAQVYRSQVSAAFERVRNEELEKNTLWMARKLGLSADQESRMRATFEDVERMVAVEFPPLVLGSQNTPQKRVMRMIAEQKRRVQLRAEQMRQVLPQEQYEAYVKAESESSASDMELFHSSGEQEDKDKQ